MALLASSLGRRGMLRVRLNPDEVFVACCMLAARWALDNEAVLERVSERRFALPARGLLVDPESGLSETAQAGLMPDWYKP